MNRTLFLFLVAATVFGLPLSRGAAAQSANAARLTSTTEAESLLRQGQWDQSIALLTRVLSHDPHHVQARNLLGIAYTGKGNLPAANREYEKALRTRPNFVPALKNLAINELTQNQVPAALRHFNAAFKLAPQDPVLHAYLGKIAYSRQDYQGASEHLAKSGELLHDPSVASELIASHLQLKNTQQAREVLQHLDPSQLTAQWQFRFGLLLAQHELFLEAIPFFQHVDSSTTQFHDASFDLAVCYVETKQFPQAIEILRTMSSQSPKTAELDTLLAEAYEGNQQTQAAIDTLQEATQLTPEDENSFVNLTALCTKYEAYDVGMKVIETGLHYHPQSDRLIFQRGVMYALTEQLNLAERDFQLAAKLAPEKNLSYAALGVSYMQAGDPAKAIASLRQRVAETPQDATLQFLLGQTLLRSGVQSASPEFAEARSALEKAVALDAKSADSRVELAKVYLKDNRLDDSVHLLEQAREIDPTNSAVYLNLVIAYRRTGKPALAATALAKLNQLNEDEGQRHPNRQRLRMTQQENPQGTTQ